MKMCSTTNYAGIENQIPMKKLTVLIPTKNRQDFVLRLLNYLSLHKEHIDVIVGDGSDHKTLKNILNMSWARFIDYPDDTDFYYKIEQMAQIVRTKYLIVCADDDFVIVENILHMIIPFLETHPDYSGAHGQQIGFKLDNDRFQYILANYFYSLDDDEAMVRWARLKDKHYPTLLGVLRTESAKESFKLCEEMLISRDIVRRGKFRIIDRLSHARQVWAGSDSSKENRPDRRTIIGDLSLFMRLLYFPIEKIYYPKLKRDIGRIKDIEEACMLNLR